jgi:hypothetical protein
MLQRLILMTHMDNQHSSEDDYEDDVAAGWAAIDTSLARLYGDQEAQHVGTILRHRLGGSDPLDGISVYRRTSPVPHWHYVTYGFSELYEKESDDLETSGYGFELTFRLKAVEGESTAPTWVFNLLQNLARYVFKTGNVFAPGDWMGANGPIALNTTTKLCSLGFVADLELPPVQTPNGRLAFVQAVGLTVEEERAAKRWQMGQLLHVLLPYMPLWITDLHRSSLLDIGEVAAQVKAGSERDGSSSGFLYTDVLAVTERRRLLRPPIANIVLGARQVEELGALLALRIPFDRTFALSSRDWRLAFEPGPRCAWSIEDKVMTVKMDPASARVFAQAVQPWEGRYHLPGFPSVAWDVQPTLIRDANGDVVEKIGQKRM